MNAMNEVIESGLARAAECLALLKEQGCTIEGVTVEGGTPLVRLAEPPPHFSFAGAAVAAISKGPTGVRTRMSVTRAGCRVTWYEDGARA